MISLPRSVEPGDCERGNRSDPAAAAIAIGVLPYNVAGIDGLGLGS